MKYNGSITDVSGIKVGQAQDLEAGTGVSVVLCENGAVCGVDVRGSAPGTRETAMLGQAKLVDRVHAVLLAGGSAYGLDAAAGVMKYLESRNKGFDTGFARVPIVPGAVIYDLGYKSASIRPDKKMGLAACENAGESVKQGSFGAGCGATVGKLFGMEGCEKSGVGTASITLKSGAKVGAIVVVNAFGDVVEYGKIIAGAKKDGKYVDMNKTIIEGGCDVYGFNTTIGAVATDAALNKDEATKLAQSGQNGICLSVSPAHTLNDGDSVFALSYGDKKADMTALTAAAAEVMRRAVINAVMAVEE